MKKHLLLILLIALTVNTANSQDYRFKKIEIPNFNSYDDWTATSLSPDSSMYLTSFSGLYRYINGSCTQVSFPLSTKFPPLNMCFNTANDYWVGSDSGLYHWNGNTWMIFDSLNSPFFRNNIKTIKCDTVTGKSYFYATTFYNTNIYGQICIYNGSTWTSIDQTNSQIPRFLIDVDVDNLGNIFLLSPDTVGIYDGNSWQFINRNNIISPYGLPFDNFTGLKASTNGSFYFSGCNYPTLTNYSPAYLVKYKPNMPLSFYLMDETLLGLNDDYRNFSIDSKANLWIKYFDVDQYNIVIEKFDGLNVRSYSSSQYFSNIYDNVTVDADDNIWTYTFKAISPPTWRFYLFNEDGFNYISGNVFIDNNNNGVKDAGELNLKNQLIHETTKNLYTNSDTSGYVLGLIDTSGSYNIELVTPPYWQVTNTPAVYAINQTHNNQKDTAVNFGIAPLGVVNDLVINGSMFIVRPGMNTFLNISYKNVGTTVLNDTVSISIDQNLTFINANPAPTFISGNYLQWVFTNLTPFNSGTINISFDASTSLVIGDTVTVTAVIGTSLNDSTPADNVIEISRIVTGSFDPNIKEVEPKGTGISGNVPLNQKLSYTIHFQNTGNDTAFKVVIKDSIDSDLDLSTFNVVAGSHPYSYKINSERLVTFTFDNILLPDSTTDEMRSHGFIKYTISPLSNAVNGLQIKNVAGIYFDYNSAVETNTTLNTLSLAAAIPSVEYEKANVVVYPNPFSTQTTIKLSDKNGNLKSARVKVYDMAGREVTSQCDFTSVTRNSEVLWSLKSNSLKGMFIYKVVNGNKIIASGKISIQ